MNNESTDWLSEISMTNRSHTSLKQSNSMSTIAQLPRDYEQIFLRHSQPEKPQYLAAFHVVQEGTMLKKTRNLHYNEKYFVLTPYRLLYYEDKTRNKLAGCFNLVALECKELSRSGLTMKLRFTKGKLTLKCLDQLSAEIWYMKLREIIKSLPRLSSINIFIDYTEKYWRQLVISLEQFSMYAESLDLVIFRSKNVSAGLQRFLTDSDYDHVGIILKDCGRLHLIDTTETYGVNIFGWQKFIQVSAVGQFQKVAYRKLLIDRKDGINQDFQQLLRDLVGKKYGLNLSKLFKEKTSSEEKENDPDRTYFCSQLVAQIYRRLGLLPSQRSACSYWPKHFAGQFPLLRGSLSDIMVLQHNQ